MRPPPSPLKPSKTHHFLILSHLLVRYTWSNGRIFRSVGLVYSIFSLPFQPFKNSIQMLIFYLHMNLHSCIRKARYHEHEMRNKKQFLWNGKTFFWEIWIQENSQKNKSDIGVSFQKKGTDFKFNFSSVCLFNFLC